MKIESHIQSIRQKLDVEKPDEDLLWIGISHSLDKKDRQKHSGYWKYALTTAASVLIAFFVGYQVMKQTGQQLVFIKIDPELAKYESEMVDQIKNYSLQIERTNYNLNELPTTPNNLRDIDQLIEMYSSDLKKYGPNPELIRSLVDLYEKKVLLLQRMLNEIEKAKNHEMHQIVL